MRLPVNVGVTFRDATVGLRESLTFPGGEIAATLDRLMARPELREAMVLCTCNRVELFAAAASGSTDEAALEALIAEWANALRLEEDYVRRAVTTRSDRDALVHALRVLASLDSLVVGEAQILGQVKEAYRLATAQNAVGPSLRLVFERGFQVAKRVRTETQLGRESVSISSVAVDLASQIFDPMSGVRVLLIGAGTMGELAARSLQEAGAESVTVVNRTHERAASLASRRGWVSRRFEDLENLYAEADVVITSTGSVRPVVHAPAVQGAMKRRRYRPLFFIDIAVPRDVASEVGELEQVYLYNIDDLEGIANRNLKTRVADVAAADTLVMEGVEAILRRARLALRQPLLARLANQAESIRDEEVARAIHRLGDPDEHARKVIFQLAHNTMQRLTRGAFDCVKEAEEEALPELTELLEHFYGLEGGGATVTELRADEAP